MADSYIQVAPDSTGKKMQTFENTVSAQTVHAEAVTNVDSTGTELFQAANPGVVGFSDGTTDIVFAYLGASVPNQVPVSIQDGTHIMPTGDAPARSINVEQTDGTNIIGTSSHPTRVDPTGTTVQPVSSQSSGSTGSSVPSTAGYTGLRGTTAYPTAVSDGQLVGAMGDKAGRQIHVLNAPRDLTGTATLSSSSSSYVDFIAAGSTGVYNDIISFIVTNESSTATIISLADSDSSPVVYVFAIAANGGIVINFPTPLPQAVAAKKWQVKNSAAVACDFVAVYAKNK